MAYTIEEDNWEDSECRANSYESYAFRIRSFPDARGKIFKGVWTKVGNLTDAA